MTMVQEAQPDAGRRIEELGRIIIAYSEVTEKLQESHQRLESTVRTLQQELGEKNRMLERRNRLAALGEMAAGMAHEIRNPLGGIQLYASMLARDLEDREESLTLVHKMKRGVKRLEEIVSQVLSFSREIRPNNLETDLVGLIHQTIELASLQMQSRSVQAVYEGPDALIAQIDPTLLGQALLNLVLNAVDAAPESGLVTVRCNCGAEAGDGARQFRLQICDNGPGIAPELLDRIFNPFFTTKDTGTGLGLAIVHRIIEAHDGTIMVSNLTPQGARFEIRI